jgi:circadian clock protein KaiC
MAIAAKLNTALCETGIAGLDAIVGGGIPRNRLYLVQGEPGTGKTTLALQFLLAGGGKNEDGLYITFSETRDEIEAVARSHGWDIGKIAVFDLSTLETQLQPEAQNSVFYPSEVEMNQTLQMVLAELNRVKPQRVVFDSVTELRMLAETPLNYRRQILLLKQLFSGRTCTVLFLDDLTAAPRDLQVQSIVHGVIHLHKVQPEFGNERRKLTVVKLRGIEFRSGNHDYVIRKGGLAVFPRIVAAEYKTGFPEDRLLSGIPELDALLGGGLDRGTSTLLLGPAGAGKSTIAMQYAYAAAQRGERAAIYAFEESMHTLLSRAWALGMDFKKYMDSGMLHIQKIDPAELSPGEFAEEIRSRVVKDKVRVVDIDSLNGYLQAMTQEKFLTLQLHELLSFLGNQGVVTILVLAQQGMMGAAMQAPVDITYLADTVIITRYFEARGAVKKAVSVVKKRGGAHETTIREFRIDGGGITVGPPLEQFQGVMSGIPSYFGEIKSILGPPHGGD